MTTAAQQYDLEHTYEFINRGAPWTRADDSVVPTGESFRALSTELSAVAKEPARFELARTLPHPPSDQARSARRVVGFQRREPVKAKRAKAGKKVSGSAAIAG